MKKLKTIKAWGIVNGKGNESITIEMKCESIKEFKERCKENGHILTGKPYISKRGGARENAGRHKTEEETKVMRIPLSLVQEVEKIIHKHKKK